MDDDAMAQEEQKTEINLRIDADGRTSYDPSQIEVEAATEMPPGTTEDNASIDYSSKAVLLASIASDSNTQRLHDELLLDCEVADCALLPRTFWVSVGAKPRCTLEKLALDVFRHHVPKGYVFDEKSSGAEWWVQLRPSPPSGRYSVLMHDHEQDGGRNPNKERDKDLIEKSGISFHWDKDEELRLMTGGTMYVHPHISTVTYLTDSGPPTTILPCTVNFASGKADLSSKSSLLGRGFVSWPKKGKHLSFDGRLLHAAPSDLMEEADLKHQMEMCLGNASMSTEQKKLVRRHRRVTFLVNIWLNYRPVGVEAFPESMIGKLSESSLLKGGLFDCTESCTIRHITIPDDKVETKEFTWPLGACGDADDAVRVRVPLEDVRGERNDGGSISVEWKEVVSTKHAEHVRANKDCRHSEPDSVGSVGIEDSSKSAARVSPEEISGAPDILVTSCGAPFKESKRPRKT